MTRFFANTFYTIRPSACLGASLLAVASFGNLSEYRQSIIMFISVFVGSASCFLINDIADVKKDLHNKKRRPIATGDLPLAHAKSVAIAFSALYVSLSIYLGTYQLIISLVTLIIFITYAFINHGYGLIANLTVALCTILSMFYGGIPDSLDPIFYFLTASTFFVIMSREIMLDILDVSGDKVSGKSSLPIKLISKGVRRAIIVGYLLATVSLLTGAVLYQPYPIRVLFVASIVSLWAPMLIKWKSEEQTFALFNIRASHVFFVVIIITLFLR